MREKIAQGRFDEMVEGVTGLLDALSERHARTLLALKQQLRQHYGRRSEKVSAEQLALLAEGLDEGAEASEPTAPQPALELDESQPRETPRARSRPGARRRPLPPDLPRDEVVVPVPAAERDCPRCGAERSVLGHDMSEVLEYVPASFRVRTVRRERRACRRCQDAVVRAPAPPQAIEKGRLGPGLLAQVLVAKYTDHAPLYRQRQQYKRHGVDLPRSTLGDAVAATTELLAPIARRIRERVLACDIVATDDTGLRVLDRDRPKGIKRGVLWPYVAEHRFAYFAYTPSREGRWPQAELAGYRGYLQVDGYAGYDALFTNGERCEVGCWAHARRYFVRAAEAGDARAAPAIAWIQGLYRVEAQAKERELVPGDRKALREAQAKPILDALAAWLERMRPRATPKSPLGQAIGYVRKRWAALTRYLDDGRLEIDNSEVERLIRLVALGRKNYLFAGSDAGAERAAIAYTVLGTCALHGIDPWAYLRDVLEKIAAGWPQREIDRLLPDAWADEHPEALGRERPA